MAELKACLDIQDINDLLESNDTLAVNEGDVDDIQRSLKDIEDKIKYLLEIRLPQNLAKVDLVIHGLFVT